MTLAPRLTKLETLKRRQQMHDRRNSDGLTQSQLQDEFNVARGTVRDWLARPRPSDEEIERVRRLSGTPGLDATGCVGFKARFAPDRFAKLRHEVDLQNASTNIVINNAVELYLACMERIRTGSADPVHLLGFRPE
jgi:transcriptional regulator with XRE-family HTH domain